MDQTDKVAEGLTKILKKNFDLCHRIFKHVEKNAEYYVDYVESDPMRQRIYEKIHENLEKDGICMKGGDQTAGLIVGGVIGGLSLLGCVISFIIWLYNRGQSKKCKLAYPLYPSDKIPGLNDILNQIVPMNINKSNQWDIEKIKSQLNQIIGTMSLLDESKGSVNVRRGKQLARIGASVVATVTTGYGGNVVNIPDCVIKAINFMIKIIDKINDVVTNVNRVSKLVGSENSNKYNKQISFVYDLFNIDFSDGPHGCECWTKYVVDHYLVGQEIGEIQILMCALNDIYLSINDQMVDFILGTINVMVPGTMGASDLLKDFLKDRTLTMYGIIRERMTNNYMKLDKKLREKIQRPWESPTMKEYIYEKMSDNTFGISSMVLNTVITETQKETLDQGFDILVYSLNRGFSLMFMFLNLFIIFASMNQSEDEINVIQMLKDCDQCNGLIDKDQIIEYDKCMGYKEKKEKLKEAYTKLKELKK